MDGDHRAKRLRGPLPINADFDDISSDALLFLPVPFDDKSRHICRLACGAFTLFNLLCAGSSNVQLGRIDGLNIRVLPTTNITRWHYTAQIEITRATIYSINIGSD